MPQNPKVGSIIKVRDYHFNNLLKCKTTSKPYKDTNDDLAIDIIIQGTDLEISAWYNEATNEWGLYDGECSHLKLIPSNAIK